MGTIFSGKLPQADGGQLASGAEIGASTILRGAHAAVCAGAWDDAAVRFSTAINRISETVEPQDLDLAPSLTHVDRHAVGLGRLTLESAVRGALLSSRSRIDTSPRRRPGTRWGETLSPPPPCPRRRPAAAAPHPPPPSQRRLRRPRCPASNPRWRLADDRLTYPDISSSEVGGAVCRTAASSSSCDDDPEKERAQTLSGRRSRLPPRRLRHSDHNVPPTDQSRLAPKRDPPAAASGGSRQSSIHIVVRRGSAVGAAGRGQLVFGG